MERIPNAKVSGDIPEQDRERLFERHRNDLFHQTGLSESIKEKLENDEVEKTEEYITYINFANEETNRILTELGLAPYDLPQENIHIIKAKSDIIPLDKAGAAIPGTQDIVIRESPLTPRMQCSIFLHEMLHMKGFHGSYVERGTEEYKAGVIYNTRFGVGVGKIDKKDFSRSNFSDGYFSGLHEAIVTTQEKLSAINMNKIPKMNKEQKIIDSLLSHKIIRDDIEDILMKNRRKVNFSEIQDLFFVDGIVQLYMYSYGRVREALKYICEELQQSFPEIYPTTDDVFKEFLRAQFSGELLTLGRLMKSTFGPDGFRTLGEMTPTDESAVETLEKLKAMRL